MNLHPNLTTAYLLLLLLHCSSYVSQAAKNGRWKLILNNTGVVAMHMALTHRNTVVMFDQTGTGRSGYQLRKRLNGERCKKTRDDLDDGSCYAHSVEYDISTNRIRPLRIKSDTWCSSGSMLSNGTLMQTGGYGSGSRRIRLFEPCGHCDWRQLRKKSLSEERWYASNLRLPEDDDRVIVIGGRRVFSYEFVPKFSAKEKSFNLPFLHKTYERNEGGNNLYPFVHLSSDGHLFIFANRDSILFDYKRHRVVKNYPKIPGKGSRSHPSTGSSVILPLDHKDGFRKVEVMICGGSAHGALDHARKGRFLKGLSSCGRMVITGNKHKWRMENMPGPRLMSDMINLPTGHVLIINGAKQGCAGWNRASKPSLQPYLYNPKKVHGKRFSTLKSTKIARMYHSSAILLADGSVLIAGSNPNNQYMFENVSHPTELRLQTFIPRHMEKRFDDQRPHSISIYSGRSNGVRYGEDFQVKFLQQKHKRGNEVVVTAYAPPFNTHSVSMNQRMLVLKCKNTNRSEDGWVSALVEAPPSAKVAPSGYYMLTIVNDGVPSLSEWVRFIHA